MTKPKDPVEIISEGIGYMGIDVKAIDKPKLRNAVRNLEDLLRKRDEAEKAALEQTIVCKEVSLLEAQYQESLRYDFAGKINEISVLVSGLSDNRFVKNTIEISEITQLLHEYEAAKDTPDKLKAKVDSMRRIVVEEPDFKELDIQHVTYEIFASMGLEKRLDETKEIRIGQIPQEILNKFEKAAVSYLREYNGLVKKKTRNLIENALKNINLKTYDEAERHEAEINLTTTLLLINSLEPLDETIKEAKRDLFHLQGITQKAIYGQFSQQVEFIDIYDKIPFNKYYISRVLDTAREVLKCKISPEK